MAEAPERLAGWLREVDLAPGAERQDAISAAATSLSGELSGREPLDLVLLAHEDHRSPIVDRVVAAVHEQDATAALRANDRETALTAAIATIFGLESAADPGVALGLAVENAAFAGLAPAISELPVLAANALVLLSEQVRARTILAAPRPDIESILSAAGDFTDDTLAIEPQHIRTITAAIERISNELAAATERLADACGERLDAADEELDVLWWCLGAFSELGDKLIKDIPEASAPIILGTELARRHVYEAPLPSTRALLARLLGSRAEKPITLGKAVPAAVKIAGGALPDVEGHRLLPVLSAVREYRQLNGRQGWKESLSRWDIESEREVVALDLAAETVREILLVGAPE